MSAMKRFRRRQFSCDGAIGIDDRPAVLEDAVGLNPLFFAECAQ
jgi:hypothetical protein